ncbi:MAG: ABC transporter permease [Acidiferrobacterales bacterium]
MASDGTNVVENSRVATGAINSPSTLWHYRDLVRNLVAKEIKVRYMGAALGFVWSLVNPIVITLMYLVIFTYIFPSTQPHYALFMVTGILHWTLFSQVTNQSCEILVQNSGLLKKIYFPRLLVPLSSVLVNLSLWLAALAVYFVFFHILGGHFTWVLLVYPFYLLLFFLFVWGVSMILSTLYVDFRDIKHLVEVSLQVLFWATPIIYELSRVPERLQYIMLLSPLAEFTVVFQTIFYRNRIPSPTITVAFIMWTAISVGLGLWLFNRRVPELVERL